MNTTEAGSIGWVDLTVDDADKIREFYANVVGWVHAGVPMGGYEDYVMTPPEGNNPAAGICWARGVNAGLPPVWLIYIRVPNLDESVRSCERLGGKVLRPVTEMGSFGRYCVIQDPAGAVAALIEPK